MPNRSCSVRYAVASLLALALAGCFGSTVPFGYDKIQHSAQFVPGELLNTMVAEHWTRSVVVAELGRPDAENEDSNAIGYERCVVSGAMEGVVIFVPLPVWGSAGDVTHCQLIKLWLDDRDQVVRWSDRTGVREIPPEGPQTYNLACSLDGWVAGGPCSDNRRWTGKDW